MSSLTDIIFLLLIFFMLTSSVVAPNALNLKFPGKSKVTTTNNDKMTDVTINRAGQYYLNGKRSGKNQIESGLRNLAKAKKPKKATITISPDPDAPIESVAVVMDIALRYGIDAIMAMEKK